MKKNIILLVALLIMAGCSLPEPKCGNGQIDVGEECDGNAVPAADECGPGEESTGITYQCTDSCTIVEKNLNFCRSICGNGRLEDGEDCDPGNVNAVAADVCTRVLGPAYQQRDVPVKCDSNCKVANLEYSEADSTGLCIPYCGNGVIDKGRGEECDGTVFENKPTECGDGMEPTGKTFECSSTCKLVDKEPEFCQQICGNGRLDLDKGEECDPALQNAFDANICGSGKFIEGKVSCGEDCVITNKTDVCKAKCGDNQIVDIEACDKENGIPYRMKDGQKEEIKCSDYIGKPSWWTYEEIPDDEEYLIGSPDCNMCSEEGIGSCRYDDKHSFSGVVSCDSHIQMSSTVQGEAKIVKSTVKMIKNTTDDINVYLACFRITEDNPAILLSSDQDTMTILTGLNTQSAAVKHIGVCPLPEETQAYNEGIGLLHNCVNSPETEPFKEFTVDLNITIPDEFSNSIFWCVVMYTGQDDNQYICSPDTFDNKPDSQKPKAFASAFTEVTTSMNDGYNVKNTLCQFCTERKYSYIQFLNSSLISMDLIKMICSMEDGEWENIIKMFFGGL